MDPDPGFATDSGEADLWDERHRILIETKPPDAAKNPCAPYSGSKGRESAYQQLIRYAEDIFAYERRISNLPDKSDPILGIITDGFNWHCWKIDDRLRPRPFRRSATFKSPEQAYNLCAWLWPILISTDYKKPAIPSDPYQTLFAPFLSQLADISSQIDKEPQRSVYRSRQTQWSLWYEMLRGSGMAPSREVSNDLFRRHTFLVAIARAVICSLTSKGDDPIQMMGDGFVSWVNKLESGKEWVQSLFDTANRFDWRAQPKDVLRDLYQQVIEKEHRKVFGEYYTPDWLAEMIVERVLDEEWLEHSISIAKIGDQKLADEHIGVLDPTCGSGTFIYWAARRIDSYLNDGWEPVQRADIISSLIWAFDIHPVAIEIARATLLRALPALPSAGLDGIRVFQGDALMSSDIDDLNLFESISGVPFRSPQGTEFRLPVSFLMASNAPQMIRQFVIAAANRKIEIPLHIIANYNESDQAILREAYRTLTNIISEEGNGVWAWYIINRFAPGLVHERRINRIIANPPWVVMKDIQVVDRKKRMEALIREEGLWAGGRYATRVDIAALFVWRCGNLYLPDNRDIASAGWITKETSTKIANWEPFRQKYTQLRHEVIRFGKVKESPFTGAKCCVWFEGITCEDTKQVFEGINIQRIKRTELWETAIEKLQFEVPVSSYQIDPSSYVDINGRSLFRNGASIFPFCLVKIATTRPSSSDDINVTTAPCKDRRWKDIPTQTGDIPSYWNKSTIYPDNLFSYYADPNGSSTIIPIGPEGALIENPTNQFWSRLEEIYQDNCGTGTSTPKTLIKRINRGLKPHLNIQPDYWTIIYNGSGGVLRAARIRQPTIITNTLCWWRTTDKNEAGYLVTLLNADILQDRYRHARKSDRDYHQHIWYEVPIPKYNPNNSSHLSLAKLCMQAEEIATQIIASNRHAGQIKISNTVRKALRKYGVATEIDLLAEKIVPAR